MAYRHLFIKPFLNILLNTRLFSINLEAVHGQSDATIESVDRFLPWSDHLPEICRIPRKEKEQPSYAS